MKVTFSKANHTARQPVGLASALAVAAALLLAPVPAARAGDVAPPAAASDAAAAWPDAPIPEAQHSGSAWQVLRAQALDETDPGHAQAAGTFLRLAELAGLRAVLDGDNDVTVFAPVDAAFDALTSEERLKLVSPEGRGLLRDLVAGHVIWGHIHASAVAGVSLRPTLAQFTVTLVGEAEADGPGEGGGHDVHGHGGHGDSSLSVNDVRTIPHEREVANGVVHQVSSLIRRDASGPAATGEVAHAPDCASNPRHAAEHLREAEVARRREERQGAAAAAAAAGGRTDRSRLKRASELQVMEAEGETARPGPKDGGNGRPGETPTPTPPADGGAGDNGGGSGSGGGSDGGSSGGCGCGGG